MLRTDELDYELPSRLIATHPADRRDEARLLVLSRSDRSRLEHRFVRDLPGLLAPGDLLVMNDTRVIPARLIGSRADTGGRVEGLYLSSVDERTWRLMLKSNGRLRPGQAIEFLSPDGHHADSTIVRLIDREGPVWHAALLGEEPTESVLARIGRTPLPPYILKARRDRRESPSSEPEDRERYQTVYAGQNAGAVAAPTAGLHFTEELLAACASRGIDRSFLTLHVGAGTFKPVETEFVDDHPMHQEWFSVPRRTSSRMIEVRLNKGRIVAVGTTTVRSLESLQPGDLTSTGESITRETDLLIAPGFAFRQVDALLTNFHLPRSTLLALVGAFLGDLDRLKAAYRVAIRSEYRFYSYGDAMLILP